MIYLNTLSAATSLSVNNREIYQLKMTIEDPSEKGHFTTAVIWQKYRGQIVIQYLDQQGIQRLGSFSLDEWTDAGGSLSAFNTHGTNPNKTSEHWLLEPFQTLLCGQISNLIEFSDNTRQISAISDSGYCFLNATNVEEINLPGLRSSSGSFMISCTQLTSVTLSSIQSMESGSFRNSRQLSDVEIDNDTFKSFYGGTFGDITYQQVIGARRIKSTIQPPLSCWQLIWVLPTALSIRNENIASIGNPCLPDTVTYADLPNLSNIVNGMFGNAGNLTAVHVDNEIYKSFDDDEGVERVILGKKDKDGIWRQLKTVVPATRAYTNNQLTEIEPQFNTSGKGHILSLHISNDVFHTFYNDQLITDPLSTRLYFCGTLTEDTMAVINSISTLSVFNGHIFHSRPGCVGIYDATFPNIVSCGDRNFYNMGTSELNLSMENVVYFGAQEFQNTGSLYKLYVPKLSSIPMRTFQQGERRPLILEDVNSVKSIGAYAFHTRRYLSSAEFNAVTSIGAGNKDTSGGVFYNAFYENCKTKGYIEAVDNYKYLNMPNLSVVTGTTANFCNCLMLSSLNISNVVNLDKWVSNTVKSCKNLNTIYCNSMLSSHVLENYKRIGWNKGCICHCKEGPIVLP